jgi:hypothetical protein
MPAPTSRSADNLALMSVSEAVAGLLSRGNCIAARGPAGDRVAGTGACLALPTRRTGRRWAGRRMCTLPGGAGIAGRLGRYRAADAYWRSGHGCDGGASVMLTRFLQRLKLEPGLAPRNGYVCPILTGTGTSEAAEASLLFLDSTVRLQLSKRRRQYVPCSSEASLYRAMLGQA